MPRPRVPLPVGNAVPPPTRPVPGVITAVRLLLGLRAVGDLMWALFGVAILSLARSVGGSLDASGAAGLAPYVTGLIVVTALCLVDAAVSIWGIAAVRGGRQVARIVLTVIPVVEIAVLVPVLLGIGVGGTEIAVSLLLAPLDVVIVALLWLPADSTQHFAPPRAPSYAALDAPTERLRLPLDTRRRGRLVWGLAAAGAVAIIGSALTVTVLRGSAETVTSLARGTWSCVSADTGSGIGRPWTVTIGDGTFSIPKYRYTGTWALEGTQLTIEVSSTDGADSGVMQVEGVPASTSGTVRGSAPLTVPSVPGSGVRNLDWAYLPDHDRTTTFTTGDGADGGAVCTKTSA